MASKIREKHIAFFLTFFMILSILSPFTAWAEEDITPAEALSKVVDYYKANPPDAPSGAWEAFVGLWGAEEDLSASPWPDYGWKTEDPGFAAQTGNNHICYIFSLLATGKNPAKAFGTNRNLFAELASHQDEETGSFGDLGKHIFAIIALDVGTELGVDVGAWSEENRNKAVDHLLTQQNVDGSFGPFSKIDYTGWSLIVLSKSKDTHTGAITGAINDAKQYLKSMQQDSGGFGGAGMWDAENCSSIACAIQGLIAIGEDISSVDGPWSKNGKTPIDALLSYQREDGSFKWQHEGTGSATNQAIVALADIVNGQSTWYKLGSIVLDQEQVDKTALGAAIAQATANKATVVVSVDGTDVEPEDKWVTQAEMDAYEAAITAAQAVYDNPNATQAEVDNAVSALVAATEAFNGAKKDGTKYTFNVRIEANDRTIVPLKEVSISIADLGLSNYGIETNFTEPKPLHVIIKALESEGIDCTSSNGIEIDDYEGSYYITGIDGLSTSDMYPWGGWLYYVNNLSADEGAADYSINNGDTIVMFFVENFMENIYTWFDIEQTQIQAGQELQLTLTGSYDDWGEGTKNTITDPVSDAAILVNDQVYEVNGETVKTDSEGRVTLTFSEPGTYHVTAEKKNVSGERIITRPYCLVTVEQTPGNGGGGGGDITPPSKEYITLSVDKKTINKGYVILPTQVELQPGDTVWSVLKRELDARNISYEYKWYDGVYVQSIDGDGEFDYGPLSGWVCKVNGEFLNYSASIYVLEDGDVVEWVYTRDLGKDVGNIWMPEVPKNVNTEAGHAVEPSATVKDGKASTSLELADIKEAIDSAKGKSEAIIIAPKVSETAKSMEVSLSKEAIKEMVRQTDSPLIIETPLGSITIPNEVLAVIAEQGSGSTVTMSLETVESSSLTPAQQEAAGGKPVYDISIMSGGKPISGFDGAELVIALPYTLQEGESAENVKVWYLNDAGELEQIDCTYDEKTGLATFKTSHLSYYVVGVEAEKIEKEEKEDYVLNFTDVKESDWFYDAVKFVVENGLFKGTGETTFSPNQPMTRAMLVTVLHNLEGAPEAAGANNFTDVKNGEWYTNAVIWAGTNDIVRGYGNGLFGTNDPITREQMAAILYSYASYKGYDVTATANFSAYTDAAEISSWAKQAMGWANAKGLITGRTATTLVPGGTATRAEVASILKRFVEGFVE